MKKRENILREYIETIEIQCMCVSVYACECEITYFFKARRFDIVRPQRNSFNQLTYHGKLVPDFDQWFNRNGR